ncbi:hypothetical protein KAFR_0F04300 [Kazachstania africana CBS 2517]|uniref:PI31 proteasome regulator C-terminal domain-containing protein n=1 Tax=Kazachstania africana (strain ATCC 22294 / BCRC 22015 / CBS 2517 / CECT 1963 / NBRC 1671 / NRRL Y-8276) TaxID=1071382 RepID=H2AXC5_KAZAF|nr:hypothetical protein KAFR_0F04300 [Kazachstania africana CBS 2517]CCF59025.1 hypothetical protein KAFR_0F04300 [Kazachstania africana CBS 2517]
MKAITSKLTLAVSLIIVALQSTNKNLEATNFVDDGTTVKTTLNYIESDGGSLQIVGLEMEKSRKCLISIIGHNDEVMGSKIFDYKDDLLISDDLKFPMEFDNFIATIDLDTITHTIIMKFNIIVPRNEAEEARNNRNEELQPPVLDTGKTTLEEQEVRSSTFKRPADMPGFEDEYEITEESRGVNPLPGLNINPGRGTGYGDVDLYPMGQRNPFNMGPNNPLGGQQGGMIFDPMGEGKHKGDQGRGPGWIPGAKFDHPFGRPSGDSSSGGSGGFFPGSSGGFF